MPPGRQLAQWFNAHPGRLHTIATVQCALFRRAIVFAVVKCLLCFKLFDPSDHSNRCIKPSIIRVRLYSCSIKAAAMPWLPFSSRWTLLACSHGSGSLRNGPLRSYTSDYVSCTIHSRHVCCMFAPLGDHLPKEGHTIHRCLALGCQDWDGAGNGLWFSSAEDAQTTSKYIDGVQQSGEGGVLEDSPVS